MRRPQCLPCPGLPLSKADEANAFGGARHGNGAGVFVLSGDGAGAGARQLRPSFCPALTSDQAADASIAGASTMKAALIVVYKGSAPAR